MPVIVPPDVQLSPAAVGGLTGLVVQLECTATGDPEPIITWLFEGGKLPGAALDINGNTLTVTIGDETEGTYYCQAHNTAGVSLAQAVVFMESEQT